MVQVADIRKLEQIITYGATARAEAIMTGRIAEFIEISQSLARLEDYLAELYYNQKEHLERCLDI